MDTPLIETARLVLRPFTEVHLTERYVGWLNDPEVVRYSENRHRRHTIKSCRDYFQSVVTAGHPFWAIHERAAPMGHIGNITAYLDRPNGVADVAIMIGEPAARGCGYGAEAWCAVIDKLLGPMGIRRVQAGTMAVNAAMRSLFHKSKMIEEGVQRGRFLLDGDPVDMVFSACFQSDRK